MPLPLAAISLLESRGDSTGTLRDKATCETLREFRCGQLVLPRCLPTLRPRRDRSFQLNHRRFLQSAAAAEIRTAGSNNQTGAPGDNCGWVASALAARAGRTLNETAKSPHVVVQAIMISTKARITWASRRSSQGARCTSDWRELLDRKSSDGHGFDPDYMHAPIAGCVRAACTLPGNPRRGQEARVLTNAAKKPASSLR